MAAKFAAYEKALEVQESHKTEEASSASFSPCNFFYGSLMDPDVLQTVLGLTRPPDVKQAKVLRYSTKMWGIYPALVPCERDGAEVRGVACTISDSDHFLRLCAYETIAYRPCFCTVVLDDGTVLEGSRTFVWAGDPGREELEDGGFDLDRYRKRFKQSLSEPERRIDRCYLTNN